MNTCKPDGLRQDQQAPKKTRRRGLVSELPFLVTEVRMPTLTVAIPSSLDAEVRDTATRRGTSLDAIVNAALGEYLSSQHHGLYQISTSAALVGGAAAGAVSSRTLLEHGDFGLGTFENLDGEMVILNGAIYQVRGDGSIKHREDGFQIPFAAVTRFQAEESFDSQAIRCLKDLELVCDPHRETANLFYALKIDGFFRNGTRPRSERHCAGDKAGGCRERAKGIPLQQHRRYPRVPLVSELFKRIQCAWIPLPLHLQRSYQRWSCTRLQR